jgi:hypothetical protein
MLVLTIQLSLSILFAALVNLLFIARLYLFLKKRPVLAVFAPGIAFAVLQIIAAIFF